MAKSSLRAYNIFVVVFMALGSVTCGFCASIIATTLGQPTFIRFFNLGNIVNSQRVIGAIQGLFPAGALLGALSTSLIADRYGRRKTVFMGSLLAITGGGLQAGSVHIAMFLLARLISGLGVGNLVTVVPLWQSEVSSPATRGFLVGLHGVFLLCGYSFANWVGVGFYYVEASVENASGDSMSHPLILLAGVMRMPESPRWLVQQGKDSKALTILENLHGTGNTEHSRSYAQLEFDQITAQLSQDLMLPSAWKDIFMIPSYRKRAIVGFLTMFFGQTTGTMVINNYGPRIYASLGFDTSRQLILTASWVTLGVVLNYISASLMDRVGRVRLMLIGFFGEVFVLMMMPILLSQFQDTDKSAGLSTVVFFIFAHMGFYGTCIDACTYVYCAEIWPMHIRAKGSALSTTGLWASSVIIMSVSPTAFSAIGWKYYFVFMSACVVAIVTIWIWWPETKMLPLEEIGKLFNDEVIVALDVFESESNRVVTEQPGVQEKVLS